MTTRRKLIPMGLSPSYVPNWSEWHAIREIVANCKDADPEYRSLARDNDDDFAAFTTSTTPHAAECIFLGQSSSRSNADKIGEFGEGMKLAALVLTRKRGASLKIILPSHTIEFLFKNVLDTRVLHAAISPSSSLPDGVGCRFEICCKDAAKLSAGRIIPNGSLARRWPNKSSDGAGIWVKGVYITTIPKSSSLYHYNLTNVTLNRDREIPDEYSLASAVTQLLLSTADSSMVSDLLSNPNCWEHQCMSRAKHWLSYSEGDNYRSLVAAHYASHHGPSYCIGTDKQAENEAAAARGSTVVHVPSAVREILQQQGVPTSSEVLPKDAGLSTIPDMGRYRLKLNEIHALMEVLDCPASISIFPNEGDNTALDGMCVPQPDGYLIWLNERLFAPGNRLERLRTALHELAHTQGGSDGTIRFEYSLDKLCGILATAYLNLHHDRTAPDTDTDLPPTEMR